MALTSEEEQFIRLLFAEAKAKRDYRAAWKARQDRVRLRKVRLADPAEPSYDTAAYDADIAGDPEPISPLSPDSAGVLDGA